MKILLLIMLLCFEIVLMGCHKKRHMETVAPPVQTEAPPPQVQQDQESGGIAELDSISEQLQAVFFDFDRSDIRNDQVTALQNNANLLRDNQNLVLTIEGHCDERGTEEYNLALGERRAKAVKDYLLSHGIAEDRLHSVSYGESRPFALGHNEESWWQNRRGQSVVLKNQSEK